MKVEGFNMIYSYWVMINGTDEDLTPPQISNISIDKQGQTLEPGDIFTIRCRIVDTSGVKEVGSVCIHNQSHLLRLDPEYYYDDVSNKIYYRFNKANEVYEMIYKIPVNTVSGKWILSSISSMDILGNRTRLSFSNDYEHWVMITDATAVHIDGTIGTPSDGKIINVPANKKYQIRADYGRWANYWYQIKSDGYVGDPITSQTKYEDVPFLLGTSINGLSNGYHYTLMEVRETATPTDKVEIPGMPTGTNYVVYELSPFDSMYEYLTSQKESGETTVGSYDIDVSGNIPVNGVLVSFNVGTRHSGKTLNVLHYHNGEVKRYTGITDQQGVLTVRVYGFSPFMIVIPKQSTSSTSTALMDSYTDSGTKYQGSFSAGHFNIEADCGKQTGAALDGRPLQRDADYTTSCMNGTTIILTDSLMKSIKDGVHTLTVYFKDGSASTTFTTPFNNKVSAVADVPATGQGYIMPFILQLIAVISFCCYVVLRRRIGQKH